eukprot:s1453_g4.t1
MNYRRPSSSSERLLQSWRKVQAQAVGSTSVASVRKRSMKWLEMAERIPDYEETEFRLSGRSYSKAQKALRRRLQQLQTDGEYPDSKLLSYCATSGMLSEVLEVLESMRAAGVQVPFASNEAALQACVPLGKWEQALSMLEDYWATDSVDPERVGVSSSTIFMVM